MLQLIIYQFNFRRQEWIGAVPLLLVSAMVVGCCFTLMLSILENIQLFHKDLPTPLFVGPIFFGGVTLFILISTLIQLLLNVFRKEYRLWNILGASRIQLSLLVGGQLAVVTLISGLIGANISFLVAKGYYYLIQNQIGIAYFPHIEIRFSLLAVCLTVLLLTFVTFVGGFYHSYKLLDESCFFEENVKKKRKIKFGRIIMLALNIFFWFSLIIGSFIVPYLDLPGGSLYKLSFLSSAVLYLLIIHIIFLKFLTPWLELKFTRFLLKKSQNYGIILSKWRVIDKPQILGSITISMVTAITLTTGLLLISNNGMRSDLEQNKEVYLSFLFYLAAPLVIIISNVISVAIISSKQEKFSISQLAILGISRKQITFVNFCEAMIYTVILLSISLVFNLVITALAINIGNYTGFRNIDNWHFYGPSLIIALLFFTILFLTKNSLNFCKDEF